MGADLSQAVIDECVGNAHGNLTRVRELVELHPGVVNARATWNETPIEAATQMGNRPMIEFLVERGAPVDFFTACVLGRTADVRRELEARPERARDRGVHELTSLYFAALGGHPEVAELLFAAGAGVNDRSPAAAPIHGAVIGRSVIMGRWLLDRGADPSLPDHEGRGARELAQAMQDPGLVELFS